MKPRHILSEVNEEKRTATCAVCGPTVISPRYRIRKDGSMHYRCRSIYYEYQLNATKPYRKHKKDYCEACGFVALFQIQLDVDHIDGDSTNNDPSNLQTLCANCHRLKTRLNWDFYSNKKEGHLSVPHQPRS